MKKKIILIVLIITLSSLIYPLDTNNSENYYNDLEGIEMPDRYYNYEKERDIPEDVYPKNIHCVIEDSTYGEYFIDFIYWALKLNYHVVEVPYVWRPRAAGFSKTGGNLGDYCRRGWKYIATTFRLLLSKDVT